MGTEFSIRDFVLYYLRHRIVTAIILVASILTGVAYNLLQVPLYKTSAQITVVGGSYTGTSKDIVFTNYVTLIKSQKVLITTSENISGYSPQELSSGITAQNEKGSEIITIEFSTKNQGTGETIILETIKSFQSTINEMYDIDEENVQIISYPIDSATAYNVNQLLQIAVAFAIGLSLTVIVSFLRFDNEQERVRKSAKLSPEEKKRLDRIAREEENIRKKEVTARIKEADAKIEEAKLRHAKTRTEIAKTETMRLAAEVQKAELSAKKAETRLREVELENKTAEAATKKRQIELESANKETSLREAGRAAKRKAKKDNWYTIRKERVNRKLELKKVKAEQDAADRQLEITQATNQRNEEIRAEIARLAEETVRKKAEIDAKTKLEVAEIIAKQQIENAQNTPVPPIRPQFVPQPVGANHVSEEHNK